MSGCELKRGMDRFEKIRELIEGQGGRIVGLEEGKLTHIVVDMRDTSRRMELMEASCR